MNFDSRPLSYDSRLTVISYLSTRVCDGRDYVGQLQQQMHGRNSLQLIHQLML